MNITKIKFRKIIAKSNLKAIVSITLDDEIVIHDVKIVQTNNKIYLEMPSRLSGGNYQNSVHPINDEVRKKLENTVITAYFDYVK